MKILVLNGSPKKKSDTFRMTDAFLKGLNKDGEHEVKVINVIDRNIAACRGCFCCWQNKDTASLKTTRTAYWTCTDLRT